MRIITEVTARESNLQNNVTSNINIEGRHFPHFSIIGVNPFRGFGGSNNNPSLENNNNDNPLPLSLLEFEGGLGGG